MQITGEKADNTMVACVVLNWNGGPYVIECLESLEESRDVAIQLVVVDNGSTDGSQFEIERKFPHVHMIKHANNVGLVHARNESVRWAQGQGFRTLFFIDNDARVTSDCLKELVVAADSPRMVGITAPRIFDPAGRDTIWFDGGYINIFGDPYHRNMGRNLSKAHPEVESPAVEIMFATGCAMLVKMAVFDAVGLFDERYFVYSEDTDFSLRARSAGFDILLVPQAKAWHHQSSDTKRNRGKKFRDYYVTRNRLLLVSERQRGLRWAIYLMYFAARHIAFPCAYFLFTGQIARIRAIIAGICDYVHEKFGARL